MPRKYSVAASPVMWQQALATDTLSSYTHDYPTLPADVAEAIYPIYEDLNNVKLLERSPALERMGAQQKEELLDHQPQHQLDLLQATDTAEGPSYGPGIDDTM
ncbi:hypothetical protein TNIN_257651 [Trichonephila inaurata madagascariensis]|uniref:Uncharacterized protein n=1 Tax=Trichonephila inaurata madagascariensis TaxID=2747483 RepID=A0A8X6XKS3_9ARAC|nr:hypothetical protein TNIN_257651 [Trichonephila inaurata madagascariensis]